jgi:hypothetical protein
MRGDKSKPQSKFGRWIDWFYDGCFLKTKKGKYKIPSQHPLKEYEKRWRRRQGKKELRNEENQNYSN